MMYFQLIHQIAKNFWSWWSGELSEILLIINRSLNISDDRIMIFNEENCLIDVHKKIEIKENMGSDNHYRLKNLIFQIFRSFNHNTIVLQFSKDLVLRRTIDLPAAAKGQLAEILYFQIDQLTPFGSDDVYF